MIEYNSADVKGDCMNRDKCKTLTLVIMGAGL